VLGIAGIARCRPRSSGLALGLADVEGAVIERLYRYTIQYTYVHQHFGQDQQVSLGWSDRQRTAGSVQRTWRTVEVSVGSSRKHMQNAMLSLPRMTVIFL
jgi:hypothetical protein